MPKAANIDKNQQVIAVLGEIDEGPESIADIDPSPLDGLFGTLDDDIETYNMCFWGREGSGKTTALAHMANVAPGNSRILIINAEGGLKKKALQRLGIDTSKIVIWPKAGEAVTFQGLQQIHRKIKADLIDEPGSWFAVGFDSVSELHVAITSQVSDARIDKARDSGKDIDEIDAYETDLRDYGTMTKIMNDLLRKFRDLPCHFVVTALERRDVDEQTGKVTYGPAITPGLQSAILGYTDLNLVFKAKDENGPFRALTKGAGMYRSKDRVGGLPQVLVQPWFDRILGYQDGELDEATDPLQQQLVKPAEKKPAGGRKKPAAKDEGKADESE